MSLILVVSSMAESLTVNKDVAGSSPALPASYDEVAPNS